MNKRLTTRILCVAVLNFLFCFGVQTGFALTTEEVHQWVDAHNAYRVRHGVPPLTWSYTIAENAAQYAATCPSGHSSSSYGENLAWATTPLTPGDVVAMWYDEISDYDYDQPGFSLETGHFTQVIWKNTTEVGCARQSGCGNWENTWVCQYNPRGNYVGQFAENVPPPVGSIDPPAAPVLDFSTSGMEVNISWTSVRDADEYVLYYAPYPYQGEHTIGSVSMGMDTAFTAQLWEDAAYYVAVKAKHMGAESGYSNIGLVIINLY